MMSRYPNIDQLLTWLTNDRALMILGGRNELSVEIKSLVESKDWQWVAPDSVDDVAQLIVRLTDGGGLNDRIVIWCGEQFQQCYMRVPNHFQRTAHLYIDESRQGE